MADPIGVQSAGGTTPYGTFYGGVHAGYEQHFASRLMLGVELDMSFANYSDLANVLSYRATATGTANEQLEYLSSLRGRAGYDIGSWTPFVTGGIAWASTRYSRTDLTTGNEDASPSNVRVGWTVGGGLDYRLDPRWTTRLEYLYTNLGLTGLLFGAAPARYDSQYDLHQFRVGLNYKFGAEDEKKAKGRRSRSRQLGDPRPDHLHLPGLSGVSARSISGPNSLPPRGPEPRDLDGVSAFLGVRLWQGGELYYNPELLQGFGVHNTTGAAGYPQRRGPEVELPVSALTTRRDFSCARTIGLGGEQEKVESGYGQLAGEKDVIRLTFQIGKFCGARRLRHQLLRQGSARRLPQLVDLGGRRVRLSRRPGRTGVRRSRPSSTRNTGRCASAISCAGNEPNSNALRHEPLLRRAAATSASSETRYFLPSRPGEFRDSACGLNSYLLPAATAARLT